MLRGFDKSNRFVLPAEMTKTLGIAPDDLLEITCDGTRIILRKHEPFCHFCGEQTILIEHNGKKICERCAVEISSKLDAAIEGRAGDGSSI